MNALSQLYKQALTSQKAGKLDEAEAGYRQILSQDPAHADSLHFLGVISYQLGRPEEAIRSITKAIGINPQKSAYHTNLGLAFQAVRDLQRAAECFEEAIRLRPENPIIHNNLGVIRLEQGRAEEAAASFRKSQLLSSNDPESLLNLGKALRHQGKVEQAVEIHQRVIDTDPKMTEAYVQLGLDYREQGDFEQAAKQFELAIELKEDYADAYNFLGACYTKLKRREEAESLLRKAVELSPLDASAHSNLGVVLLELGRHDEARESIEEALRLRPDAAGARSNLGAACLHLGEVQAALDHIEEALRIEPDNIDAHWNRSLIWLMQGEFRKGWLEYEWRTLRPESRARKLPRPLWDGSELEGRKILLHAEQGFGDTIQFCRYAKQVAERGGEVLLACQKPLVTLLTQCTNIPNVIAKESGLLQFDLHAPLMSLPGILRDDETAFPSSVPYIHPAAELVDRWAEELPQADTLRIGIAWQGNQKFAGDQYRSLPLKHFTALGDLPGVQLISLQKGFGSEQIDSHQAELELYIPENCDEENGPFMDTAAIMKNLDLVITSDTVIPHLAGAVGVPVWLLLSSAADWRWLLDREDSPWYPSLRVFRQETLNDWEELFERVLAECRQTFFSTSG